MRNIRCGIIILLMLVCNSATSVSAQVSIGIGLPNVSIGINLPLFPELVPVPGYPVYYAPRLDTNYFFYDGMYWVYSDDNWYASNWYNGPWSFVEPAYVPLYILRVPIRYYRQPPVYFRGWHRDAPPRWGQHWGPGWEQNRRGWDQWKRGSAPSRAPLPVYQREYSGDRYPRVEQQQELRREHYRYQPRDKAVRQNFQQQSDQRNIAPARRERQDEQRVRNATPQPQPQQRGPAIQEPRREQRPEQGRDQRLEQRQEPRYEQSRPQVMEPRGQERERSPEYRGQGQGQGHEQRREEGRGRGRDN